MFKTRFISMLALLITAVSGAWADTTVTWEGTKLQSIAVCKGYGTEDPTPESMTVDGITITANNGFLMNDQDGVMFLSGAANGVVFSAENNIKSITITSTDFSRFTPDGGYQVSGGSHTYEVSPAATSYGFPTDVSINGITKIEITLEGPATVAVTGVTLLPTTATLTLGETETVTLTATVLPGDATDKSVTWSSSNEAVATVADGVVTAVAAGEATITVTTTDGAKTATCAVTVAAPAASTYTVTLKEGTDDATSWTIAPDEATTTGVAAGTEVKATYGGAKKVKSVKAVKKAAVPVTAITLNKTATTIYKVNDSSTETLSVTAVTPDEATDKTYTWSSDDITKATVDQNGVVTAVAAGTAHIRATANDGSGVYGECTVTVSDISAYYSKMVECGCDDLNGQCCNARGSFTGQVLSADQAIVLAQAKAAETGSNCAVFYDCDRSNIKFAKNDGTTGSARFTYSASEKGLSGYKGFYVSK